MAQEETGVTAAQAAAWQTLPRRGPSHQPSAKLQMPRDRIPCSLVKADASRTKVSTKLSKGTTPPSSLCHVSFLSSSRGSLVSLRKPVTHSTNPLTHSRRTYIMHAHRPTLTCSVTHTHSIWTHLLPRQYETLPKHHEVGNLAVSHRLQIDPIMLVLSRLVAPSASRRESRSAK